jgi:hypothetical protein
MRIYNSLMLLATIAFLGAVPCVAQTNVHYINVGQAEAIVLEFKTSAVLIDADGELTCIDASKNPVSTFLKKFFEQRPHLNKP